MKRSESEAKRSESEAKRSETIDEKRARSDRADPGVPASIRMTSRNSDAGDMFFSSIKGAVVLNIRICINISTGKAIIYIVYAAQLITRV